LARGYVAISSGWSKSARAIKANRHGKAAFDPAADLARYFLGLANPPNCALDRLSRYEATLWRQVGQILFALDT
jgi:hypothetical protein